MRPSQASAIILIAFFCERTSSTADLSNHKNLYQFGYTVRDESTRDFKTHQEVHDGKQVRGMYSLGEPNGDVRVVTYTADATNGFRAAVKVHPAKLVDLPTVPSGKENKQTPGGYTSITQTINQENKYENEFQINNTPPTVLNNPFDNKYGLNTSEPEVHVKGTTIKDTPQDDSENLDIPKSGPNNHLYNAHDENEQIMILDDDYLLKSEHNNYQLQPPHFRQSSLSHAQETPFQEPQIIPVKIQDDAELLESESNIEMSTFYPTVNEDIIYENEQNINPEGEDFSTTKLCNENNNVSDGLHISQIEMLDQNLHKSEIKVDNPEKESTSEHQMELIHSLNKETVEKTESTIISIVNESKNRTLNQETKSDKTENILALPVLETSLTNNDVSQNMEIQNKHENNIKTEKNSTEIKFDGHTKENGDKTIKQDLLLDTHENKHMATKYQLNHDNIPIMLAALLVPTSTVLKLTCFPNIMEKEGIKTTPTLPTQPSIPSHQIPFQNGQNPVKSVFTTGAPVYPFQLIHFSKILNSEDNKQASPQHPVPTFSTRPQATFTDGLRTKMPQQITYSYPILHNAMTTFKPGQVYSGMETESVTHPSHKLYPIGQYNPHFLPPPWAFHPFRSTSHHRQMPIFVLPMSHNSNFAPTFNPRLHDNFNQ